MEVDGVFDGGLKIPLKIVASDITNKVMLVLDSELHQDIEVVEAVRMSMSIPPYRFPTLLSLRG